MSRTLLCIATLFCAQGLMAQDDPNLPPTAAPVSKSTLDEIRAMLLENDQQNEIEWKSVANVPVPKNLRDFSFSPDGDSVVFCDDVGKTEAWQLTPLKKQGEFEIEGAECKVALSSNGMYGLIGGDFEAVVVWSTETGKEVFRHEAFKSTVAYLQVSIDDQYMIGADSSGSIMRYPLLGGQGYTMGVDPGKNPLKGFAAAADGSQVVYTVGADVTLMLAFPTSAIPRSKPNPLGGTLNGAERLAFGTKSFAGVKGGGFRFIFPNPESPERFSVASQRLNLVGIHEIKITADDKLLGAITSNGQLQLINPRAPSINAVSAPPVKGPVTGPDDARLAPNCRRVAVHRFDRLEIWEVVSDPISKQARIHEAVAQLLELKQYKELSTLTNDLLRRDETRYEELRAQLKPSSVPSQFEERIQQLDEWIDVLPEDLLPRLLLSEVETAKGWTIRGSGYAASVSEEQWQGFRKHIDAAAKYLDGYQPDEFTPGSYYGMRIGLHKSQGSPHEDFKKTTDQLLKHRPRYIPGHEAAIEYLMPRWHGEPGECAFYAMNAAQAIGGEEGQKLYVHLAESQLAYYKPDEFFPVTEFDYDRILKHLQGEATKTLSASERDHVDAQLMRFARRKGDKLTAQVTFARILVNGWMGRNKNNARVYNDVMGTIVWLQEGDTKGISLPRGTLESLLPPLPSSNKKPSSRIPKKSARPAGGA